MKQEIYVVLVEPEYEPNVGAIARLMKNFKAKQLILVNPQCEIETIAKMYAKKGEVYLKKAKVVGSLEEAIKGMDFVIATTGVRRRSRTIKGIIPLRELKVQGKRIAVIFGRESIGLKKDEYELADITVKIESNPEYPILNLSHAAGIVLWWLYSQTHTIKSESSLAKKAEREVLVRLLSSLFDCETVWRKIFARARMKKNEFVTLIKSIRERVKTWEKEK